MIYTYLGTAFISTSLAFGAGWRVNQWRFDSAQKHSIEQAALAQQELQRREQVRSSAALAAQVLARKSEARLRHDAAASKSAYVRLQDTSSRALRTAASNLEACTAISNTFGELLTESTGRYKDLATKADEHLIDLRTQLDTP